MTRQQEVLSVFILEVLSLAERVEWKDLTTAIRSKFVIVDWMSVRDVIYTLAQRGLLERVGEGEERVARELYAITADGRKIVS